MGILASARQGKHNPPGRWVMVPKDLPEAPKRRRNRVILRRRRNFLRLVIAAAGSFIIGLIPHLHVFLYLNLLADAALVGYVLQLRRWRRAEVERAHVVRTLPFDQAGDLVRERSSG